LSTKISSYATLFGAQIAIGAAAIFARFALEGAGPVVVSALRLTIAGLPLLAFSWRKSITFSIPGKHELLFALSGVALAVHFATWIGSLRCTSVAVSTLLVCTSPVWTALYDIFILKQKMSRNFWYAFMAAGLGLALIVCSSGRQALEPGLEWTGDLLAIIGAIAIAGYLIAIRSVSHIYPTIVIVGRTYSWSALALVMVAISIHDLPPGNDAISWGGILAMALISQLIGHTALNASLRTFSSSTVAFSTLLEPVCAAVLAALLFKENLTPLTISGSILVLAALAVILRLQPIDVQQQIAKQSNEL
jgi:drug/metabolite transporter (DMT)-like permease